MTKANCEGMVINNDENINGLCFSPDFDTGQQISIGRFIKSIRENECKVKKLTCKIQNKEIPMLRFGANALSDYSENMQYLQRRIKIMMDFSNRTANNIEYLQKQGICCVRVTLKDEEYLIEENNMFFVFVDNDDCMFFVANPYIFIAKEDELLQNKKYRKDCYLKIRRVEEKLNSYTSNLKKRQKLFLKEMNEWFDLLEKNFNENGYVIGNARIFLNNAYVLLTGTKQDSDISIKENIFPYNCKEGKMKRYSKEELDNIKKERDEYERKCSIVDKRLDILEEVLRNKGRTWTIISRSKINFNENNDYTVWMNAQDYDNASFGWFNEQDFIDWANMEGRIPFEATKIKYWAEELQKVSNGDFTFVKIQDNLGEFERKDGGIIRFTEENIKLEIEKYTSIVRFTYEDLEREIKKRNKKKPFTFLKKLFA